MRWYFIIKCADFLWFVAKKIESQWCLFWPMILILKKRLSSDSCQKCPKDSQPLRIMILIKKKECILFCHKLYVVITVSAYSRKIGASGWFSGFLGGFLGLFSLFWLQNTINCKYEVKTTKFGLFSLQGKIKQNIWRKIFFSYFLAFLGAFLGFLAQKNKIQSN